MALDPIDYNKLIDITRELVDIKSLLIDLIVINKRICIELKELKELNTKSEI